MATQVSTLSAPLVIQNESTGGIITQIIRLFIQPKAFFRAMPANRQWLLVALLALVIAGFTATTQTQVPSSTTTAGQITSFDLSLLDESATSTDATTAQQTSTSAAAVDSDTSLMNGLVAASGVIIIWAGQATFLSLVTMLRGYSPQIGKSLQIAIWASLPLTLMLILRYLHYANGGTGGSLGLSLLLDNWSGYAALPQLLQRVLAVFASNLTLFWLWNLALLYFGARYALGGRRLAVMLVVLMWIITAAVVPALVTDPQTTITNIPTTTSAQQTNTPSNSTTTTEQGNFPAGDFPSGGQFPVGSPPSGGPPRGN